MLAARGNSSGSMQQPPRGAECSRHRDATAPSISDFSAPARFNFVSGSKLRNRRVAVWWENERLAFQGQVKEFDEKDNTIFVQYDDGDCLWHPIEDFPIALQADCAPVRGSERARRGAAPEVGRRRGGRPAKTMPQTAAGAWSVTSRSRRHERPSSAAPSHLVVEPEPHRRRRRTGAESVDDGVDSSDDRSVDATLFSATTEGAHEKVSVQFRGVVCDIIARVSSQHCVQENNSLST